MNHMEYFKNQVDCNLNFKVFSWACTPTSTSDHCAFDCCTQGKTVAPFYFA